MLRTLQRDYLSEARCRTSKKQEDQAYIRLTHSQESDCLRRIAGLVSEQIARSKSILSKIFHLFSFEPVTSDC